MITLLRKGPCNRVILEVIPSYMGLVEPSWLGSLFTNSVSIGSLGLVDTFEDVSAKWAKVQHRIAKLDLISGMLGI